MAETDVILTDPESGLMLILRHNGTATIDIPVGAREREEIASLLERTVAYLRRQQNKHQTNPFDEKSQ